jgi:hypothetical protein
MSIRIADCDFGFQPFGSAGVVEIKSQAGGRMRLFDSTLIHFREKTGSGPSASRRAVSEAVGRRTPKACGRRQTQSAMFADA